MARYHIRQFVLDGNDLDAMVLFWSAALGYELDHRQDDYAALRDPDGVEPQLFLQRVPEPKTGKNRAHLDIEVADEQATVTRLIGLGATEVGRDEHWTVLADPQGNEFCVGYFG